MIIQEFKTPQNSIIQSMKLATKKIVKYPVQKIKVKREANKFVYKKVLI